MVDSAHEFRAELDRQDLIEAAMTLLRHLLVADTHQGPSREPWLTVEEAAAYVAVSPETIRSWIGRGLRHGRAGRLYRFRRSDLDAFLLAHESDGDRSVPPEPGEPELASSGFSPRAQAILESLERQRPR